MIRSKNSGPFQTTLDVIFDDPELYMQIKASGQITPERVSQPTACLRIVSANSYSLILRWDSRSPLTARFPPVQSGDRDVYGAQQHAPLAMMEIQLE